MILKCVHSTKTSNATQLMYVVSCILLYAVQDNSYLCNLADNFPCVLFGYLSTLQRIVEFHLEKYS